MNGENKRIINSSFASSTFAVDKVTRKSVGFIKEDRMRENHFQGFSTRQLTPCLLIS